jgi:tetratricopeptide (TPR) repeat protein
VPGMLPGLAKLKQMPEEPSWAIRPLALGLVLGALVVGCIGWSLFQLGGAVHLEFGKNTPSNTVPTSLPTYTGEPDVVWAKYRQAGLVALDKQRFVEAEDLFNLSLGEADKTSRCDAHTATNLTDLARTYVMQEKLSDAEKACAKALNIRHAMHETNERPIADIFAVYAGIHLARDDYKNADTYLQKALAIQQRELGPTHQDVATTINLLGRAAQGQKNYPRAEAYYKQALAIRTGVLGPNKLPVAETLNDYARLLKRTKRTVEAERMEARAKAIRAEAQEQVTK